MKYPVLYPLDMVGKELFRRGESKGWFPKDYLESKAGAHWAGYPGDSMTYGEYRRKERMDEGEVKIKKLTRAQCFSISISLSLMAILMAIQIHNTMEGAHPGWFAAMSAMTVLTLLAVLWRLRKSRIKEE